MGTNAAAVAPRRLAVDTFLLAVLLPRGLPSLRSHQPLHEVSNPIARPRTALPWIGKVIRMFPTFTPGTINGSDIIVAATIGISTSISRGHTDASPAALDRNMYSRWRLTSSILEPSDGLRED